MCYITFNLSKIDWVAISALITAIMVGLTATSLYNSKKQLQELQRQNFENTFYQLLKLVKETLKDCTYIDGYIQYTPIKVYGREAFEKSYDDLSSQLIKREIKPGVRDETTGDWIPAEFEEDLSAENAELAYDKFYDRFPDVGLYFKTLYRLIKLINQPSLSEEDKYKYTSIVRAQLSDYELLWLFYNCAVGNGQEKFLTLVEQWALLKNLRKDKLAHESHYDWISEKAFNHEG